MRASSAIASSRVTEKLAARNGPRHSVYWVQRKKSVDVRLPTHSSVLDATAMGGGVAARVEYSLVGKYTGEWKDGAKHGYGVLVYANGNKFEGDWREGRREGKGVYWVHDKKKKKLRKQYAGEWADDQRHGLGSFFQEDGGRFEGYWARNKREGDGRMVYGADRSVYEGQWSGNVRSGRGRLTLANGDVYDGYWLNDKKDGPGRFFYRASGKVYDGEWADGAPKCGTYYDSGDAAAELGDSSGSHRFQLPELELAHPEQVVSASVASLRQERLRELASGATPSSEALDGAAVLADGTGVVFDERTMRLIQTQFAALEQSEAGAGGAATTKPPPLLGCIRCAALPQLVGVVGLALDAPQLREFLDELGATPDTLVSLAECVDILSLLAESEMGGRGAAEGDDDDDRESEAEEED
ncbi:hypothetical protein PybrP1_002766 [[Pythium] brassicae (nom. inval.)]|nr:hypothetical protein PybrP1_002766 [[Pythium] brassicae (nom. inval.)]